MSLTLLAGFVTFALSNKGEEERLPAAAPQAESYEIEKMQIPLHRLEKIPVSEPEAIAGTNQIFTEFFKKSYEDSSAYQRDSGSGMTLVGTRRGVHPKAHGCLLGKMVVASNLKESDRVGIFQSPAQEYPVFARFSNGSPRPNGHDSAPDTRGFGLKVLNVPGKNMLQDIVGAAEQTTQEFTMNTSDAFFADDAATYRRFMQIALLETSDFTQAATNQVFEHFKYGRFLLGWRVKTAFEDIQTFSDKTFNPLGIQYFSITPFQHGNGNSAPVVKYSLRPCDGVWEEPVDRNDPNFLRANLKAHIQKKPACFSFLVQDQNGNSVEDPTRPWKEKKSPFREIARIQFPAQDLVNEATCEHAVINPWNTLPEHKPVGGINRLRLSGYLMSIKARKKSNNY